jgi:spore coat polysaccharide biosynthesis protein SpsF
MDLVGRPLLGRVIDRVGEAKHISRIIVATSDREDDDPIERFCEAEGVVCVRGPLDDVIERYRQAVIAAKVDAFVRITGDSPLVDPAVIDRGIDYFLATECDLSTNVLVRTFPVGQSVEVLSVPAFLRTCGEPLSQAQREHLTLAYYEQPEKYRIVGFTSGGDFGRINLSVDTLDDFRRAQELLTHAGGQPSDWRTLARTVTLL